MYPYFSLYWSLGVKMNKCKHHLFCLRVWNQQKAFSLVESICNFGIFKYHHTLHIYILYTKKIGDALLSLNLIILLCFFVLPIHIFMGNEIFSATFEFFAIAEELSTFYVHNSHMSPDNKKNWRETLLLLNRTTKKMQFRRWCSRVILFTCS